MSRPIKVLLVCASAIATTALATACGTQRINLPKVEGSVSPPSQLSAGAQLFSQRCAGCHTLSYAATHGSAANVRTAQANNGPNFDDRCERPATRVLYAIENGGFSGAIMPQNVVVGQDAIDVAEFVSTYAGRNSPPPPPGEQTCRQTQVEPQPLPPPGSAVVTTSSTSSTATTAAKPKRAAKRAASKPARP